MASVCSDADIREPVMNKPLKTLKTLIVSGLILVPLHGILTGSAAIARRAHW